eukprot:4005598-Prorocentrum_lima.AAC.1
MRMVASRERVVGAARLRRREALACAVACVRVGGCVLLCKTGEAVVHPRAAALPAPWRPSELGISGSLRTAAYVCPRPSRGGEEAAA